MKKLLFITLSLLIFACSKDNDNDPYLDFNSVVELLAICGDVNSNTTYCVSREQYNWVDENVIVGNPCWWITITDVEGNNYSGYLKSWAPEANCGPD